MEFSLLSRTEALSYREQCLKFRVRRGLEHLPDIVREPTIGVARITILNRLMCGDVFTNSISVCSASADTVSSERVVLCELTEAHMSASELNRLMPPNIGSRGTPASVESHRCLQQV